MRIWLVQPGEPLPCDDNGKARILRTGILAKYLSDQGNEVIWWASRYSHTLKIHREVDNNELIIKYNYKIKLLNSCGYKTNISLRRIIDHAFLSLNFIRNIKLESKPDIILASFPPVDLAAVAVYYAKKNNIPIVIDVRDMWPDLFYINMKSPFKLLIKVISWPYEVLSKYAFKNATAITGLTIQFIQWAAKKSMRDLSKREVHFPMGYLQEDLKDSYLEDAYKYWGDLGINNSNDQQVICFFGTFGSQFKFEPIKKAAKLLAKGNSNLKFVLCGSGPSFNKIKQLFENDENVLLPGWVDKYKIHALMTLSIAGIAPYINNENFMNNIPNKPVEYLSNGLPVIISVSGVIGNLLTENKCGYVYDSENSLVKVINELSNNRELRKKMSINAKKLFKQKFDSAVINNSMSKYLDSIIIESKY